MGGARDQADDACRKSERLADSPGGVHFLRAIWTVRLGTKRQCQACGAKCDGFAKRPVVCARCGAEVDLDRMRKRPRAKAAETAAPEGKAAVAPPPAAGATSTLAKHWSSEQAAALDKVSRWLRAAEPQVFRLFGYAGVGKTTLARHVAEGAQGETAFAAFTGKAALVMRSKGCVGATTIHALIYRATEADDGAPKFKLNADGPASR